MRRAKWAEEVAVEEEERGTGMRHERRSDAGAHERRMRMSGDSHHLLHPPTLSLGCHGTAEACSGGGGTAAARSEVDGVRTTKQRSASSGDHGRPLRPNPSLDLSRGWRLVPPG